MVRAVFPRHNTFIILNSNGVYSTVLLLLGVKKERHRNHRRDYESIRERFLDSLKDITMGTLI